MKRLIVSVFFLTTFAHAYTYEIRDKLEAFEGQRGIGQFLKDGVTVKKNGPCRFKVIKGKLGSVDGVLELLSVEASIDNKKIKADLFDWDKYSKGVEAISRGDTHKYSNKFNDKNGCQNIQILTIREEKEITLEMNRKNCKKNELQEYSIKAVCNY